MLGRIVGLRLWLSEEQHMDCTAQPTLAVGRQELTNQHQIDLDFAMVPSSGISRLHALLYIEEERLSVQDFNSRNGTRLNGYQLLPMRRYPVHNGDWLTFGKTELRIQLIHADQTVGDQ